MFHRSLIAFCLFLVTAGAFGQNVKTLTLSPDFAAVPGTPRVIFNASKNVWVVVWRQGGAIRGRTVKADGTMTASKNLAIGASTSDQSFDIAYNSDAFSYLVAFENAAGLQVRFVSATLVGGASHLIEAGAKGTMARLVYDPVGKRYFVFWLGSQDGARSALSVRPLDVNGNPTALTVKLASAGAGKTFDSLNLARNPKNGNMLAIALQKTTTAGAVLKVNVTPNGGLQGTPATFQALTAALETVGSASFSNAGTGFGFWSDKTSIKRRKVTLAGGFGSGIAAFANSADTNSRQVAITFSSSANQFAGAWTKGNQVFAVNLNSTSGAPVKAPAPIATSTTLAFARNANVATDAKGNTLVVWEDSNLDASIVSSLTAKFHIRGAIITGGGGGGGTMNVSIGDNFFSPSAITISVGTNVIWTHNGNNPHTVTSGSPSQNPGTVFDSPTLGRGGIFQFMFSQTGSFPYFCRIHGAIMSGTVTVQ